MSRMFRCTLAAMAGLLLATSGVGAVPALAQTRILASEPVQRRVIFVPRDKSLQFRLPGPASRIVISQPETAKVTATSNSTFYVQGIEFGATNMLVYDRTGQLAEVIDVRVGYDAEGLQQDLRIAYPDEAIQVRNLGEGLMLTGNITSSVVRTGAEKLAERYAPDAVISRMMITNVQQVVLEVRILEASRNALQDVGLNFNVMNESFAVAVGKGLMGVTPPATSITTNGGIGRTSIDTNLQLLEEKGVVRTLARPNLVAMSGEKANFLAGGEFPFPVPSRDGITIEFRPYGVKLNFTPTIQDNGWIRLEVAPEVSQLDYNNAVTVSGITIPALTVRRAGTTLELRDGDSFAMAGLFQHDYQNNVQQTPWAANLPVLGALFRSARWKRAESELLIVVTARLSTPADRAIAPPDAMPGREPTGKDLFLMGKSLDKPLPRVSGAEPTK